MNTLDSVLLAIAVLALVLYRQLRTRRLDEGRLYVLPVFLGVVGLFQGSLVDKVHPALSIGLLAVEAVAALALGGLRAVTVRIWRDERGVLWKRGNGWTAGAWLLSIAVRAGMIGAGYAAGIVPGAGGVLLFLGLTLLAQNLLVGWRARRLSPASASSVVP
ncbi:MULTISPECIES: hypothetical protein [Thermomonosporaceae]|uniref:hypothetical protein n=1 Tax=Thermomonosporaceae TaxID=2012 RepID=UPI00255B0621|nr:MULTISPECIES: hypothetical protein [Thermomonosporaceae]MDL4775126.1 hypothetical protein [Actinomadura xylanilytica]